MTSIDLCKVMCYTKYVTCLNSNFSYQTVKPIGGQKMKNRAAPIKTHKNYIKKLNEIG